MEYSLREPPFGTIPRLWEERGRCLRKCPVWSRERVDNQQRQRLRWMMDLSSVHREVRRRGEWTAEGLRGRLCVLDREVCGLLGR